MRANSRMGRERCGNESAASSAVSFSRHSVDLRVRCYDIDAQDRVQKVCLVELDVRFPTDC